LKACRRAEAEVAVPSTERYVAVVVAPREFVEVAGEIENIGKSELNVEDAAVMLRRR